MNISAVVETVAARADLQDLYLTVAATVQGEYVVTLYDPGLDIYSRQVLSRHVGQGGLSVFYRAVDEAASKALSDMRAFGRPPLSPECPCGIHRSRCEYHGGTT